MFARVRPHRYSMPIDIPVEMNYSIPLSSLTSTFPGACGLKYLTLHSDIFKAVRCANDILFEPEGGWFDKDFVCTYPKDIAKKLFAEEEEAEKKKETINLIALGLNYDTTDQTLRIFLQEKFGQVMFCEIKRDHDTGRSKGFAFFRFSDYAGQVRAIAAKRVRLDDRWVNIKPPLNKDGIYELPSKIFIARLQEDISSPQGLHNYFRKYGEIVDIVVPELFPGIAYVTFLHPESAEAAVNMQHFLNGKSVHVCLASNGNQYRKRWLEKFNKSQDSSKQVSNTAVDDTMLLTRNIENFLFNQCPESSASVCTDAKIQADSQVSRSDNSKLKSVVNLLSSLLNRAAHVLQLDSIEVVDRNSPSLSRSVKEESVEARSVKNEPLMIDNEVSSSHETQNKITDVIDNSQSSQASNRQSTLPEAIEKESAYYIDIKKEPLSPPAPKKRRKRTRFSDADPIVTNQPNNEDELRSKISRVQLPEGSGNFQDQNGRPISLNHPEIDSKPDNLFHRRPDNLSRGFSNDWGRPTNDPDVEFVPSSRDFQIGTNYNRERPPMDNGPHIEFIPNDFYRRRDNFQTRPDNFQVRSNDDCRGPNGDYHHYSFNDRDVEFIPNDFERRPDNFQVRSNDDQQRPPRGPNGFNNPDIEFIHNAYPNRPDNFQNGPSNVGYNQQFIKTEPQE